MGRHRPLRVEGFGSAVAAVPVDDGGARLPAGTHPSRSGAVRRERTDARLDTLFLAMPVSWRGTIQQYAGHLHRLRATKLVVRVYDYVDAAVPVLSRMYQRRLKGYKALGYAIQEAPGPS